MLRRALLAGLAAALLVPAPAAGLDLEPAGDGGLMAVFTPREHALRGAEMVLRAPGGRFARARPLPARGHVEVDANAVGEAVFGWSEASRAMVAARRRDGTLTEAVQLSRRRVESGPFVAINERGDAAAAWHRLASGGGSRVEVAGRPAGSERWSAPESLTGLSNVVDVAVEPSGAVLLVSSGRPGLVLTMRPPGGRFGARTTLGDASSEDGEFARLEELVLSPGGEGLLVWREGPRLLASRRAPAGPWGAPEVLDEEGGAGAVAAARDGQALVAWARPGTEGGEDEDGFTLPPRRAEVRVARAHGRGELSPGTTIARGGLSPVRLAVDVNTQGDGAVAWRDEVTGAIEAATAATGGAWAEHSVQGPIRPLVLWHGGPAVALDERGRATVGWEDSDGQTAWQRVRDIDIASRALGPVTTIARRSAVTREGPRTACSPKGSRTVVASRIARVFLWRAFREPSLTGCLYARGARVELSDELEVYAFPPPAVHLAGPLVGWAGDACDPEDCTTFVELTDLRDEFGGIRQVEPAIDPALHTDMGVVGSVRATPRGALAWTSCATQDGPPMDGRCGGSSRTARVMAVDAGSETPRVLDRGPGIDMRSLAVRGETLSWRRNGRLRHAILR